MTVAGAADGTDGDIGKGSLAIQIAGCRVDVAHAGSIVEATFHFGMLVFSKVDVVARVVASSTLTLARMALSTT